MDAKTLLLILAGFAVVTAGFVLAVRLGHRVGGDVDLVRGRRRRPWWGHPGLWLLVSAAFALVGLFVFPKLFGFTFLFLPFIWPFVRVGGVWRGRPNGDRTPPRPDPEDPW